MPIAIVSTLTALVGLAFVSATAVLPVVAQDAWIAEAPPGVRVLAGYLTLVNRGDHRPYELQGAYSPDFGRVEMHRTLIRDGLADMEEVKCWPLPARGRLAFVPGGNHFMLYDPKRVLRAGDKVQLVLRLSGQWNVTLTMPVRDRSLVRTSPHH